MSSPASGQRLEERRQKYLFLSALLAIYLTVAAGHIAEFDAYASIETAKALIDRGSFRVVESKYLVASHFALDAHGGGYTRLGLVHPFLYIVPVLVGRGIAGWAGTSEDFTIGFFVSLVNCFVTVAIVTLFYCFLRRRGDRKGSAVLVAATLALATALFPYSKKVDREPVQALFLLGTFLFSCHPNLFGSTKRSLALGGSFAALAFLTKAVLLLAVFPAILYATRYRWRTPRGREELVFLFFPLLVGALAWSSYAYCAFGKPWALGYGFEIVTLSGRAWSTSLWRGLFDQAVSLNSIWFHSPVLLLALTSSVASLKRRQFTLYEATVWSAILIQVIIYSRWVTPMGGGSLGPRYLVPTVCLFALLWKPPVSWSWSWGAATACIVSFSFLLQLVQISVKPTQFWIFRSRVPAPLAHPHWYANIKFFLHKWRGKPERYAAYEIDPRQSLEVDLTDARSLQGFNFWWAHWRRYQRHPDRAACLDCPTGLR